MTVGRKVAVASAYAVLQRVLLRGLGLANTLILVRLLAPEDFGIVALAATLHATLDQLGQAGIGMALIRMRDPRAAHYDTAFTLNLVRGGLIAAGLLALADWQAAFMGDARIADVIRVLAVAVALQSLESIRMIDLQRDLHFDRLMRYYVLQKVTAIAIALPFAFVLRNYWALVVALPLNWLVMLPVSYCMAPYRPRLSLAHWREFFDFSKWLFVGNLFQIVESQMFNVIVGRLQGVAAVGLYQVAYQVAALPISEIAAPVRGPHYAGLAQVQNSLAELRRHVLTGLELQWVVILPLSVGIALTAHEITVLFLGQRWLDLVDLMALVALFAVFDAVAPLVFNLLLILNRQPLLLVVWSVLIVLRVGAVIQGVALGGLTGAGVGMLAGAVLSALAWLVLTGRVLRVPLAPLGTLWRGSVAAAAMAAVLLVLLPDPTAWFGGGAVGAVAVLGLKAGLGALVYCGVLLGCWRLAGAPAESAEAHMLRLVRPVLVRLRLLRVAAAPVPPQP